MVSKSLLKVVPQAPDLAPGPQVKINDLNRVYEAADVARFHSGVPRYTTADYQAELARWEGEGDTPSETGQDHVSGGAAGADHVDVMPVDVVQSHVDAIVTDLRSGVVKPPQREKIRDALQDAAVGSIIGRRP